MRARSQRALVIAPWKAASTVLTRRDDRSRPVADYSPLHQYARLLSDVSFKPGSFREQVPRALLLFCPPGDYVTPYEQQDAILHLNQSGLAQNVLVAPTGLEAYSSNRIPPSPRSHPKPATTATQPASPPMSSPSSPPQHSSSSSPAQPATHQSSSSSAQ